MKANIVKSYKAPTLYKLWKIFHNDEDPFPAYELVEPSEVPETFKQLLWNDDLITPHLEKFYGTPLITTLLDKKIQNHDYTRKMAGGIKRKNGQLETVILSYTHIHLKNFPSDVSSEILEGSNPLGRIIIEHKMNVKVICQQLVKIYYWKELDHFCSFPTYGRLVTFFIDSKPSVELLDIISGAPKD